MGVTKQMRESAEHTAQQKRIWFQTAIALLAILAFMVTGILGFLRFYDATIDGSLYAERLNQMREVTAQLFSGLEDVVKSQWQRVEAENNTLRQEHPQTLDRLLSFMRNQVDLGNLEEIQCNLIAVDAQGWYYTQAGRQGLVAEREYLADAPERLSFVSNKLTNTETRMVFLRRLEEPMVLENSGETITLTYFGLSQNMEELNPYFACKAYSGSSSVYVVDDDGLKLFSSSSSGDLLRGYNVFSTLRSMDYLHGTSFEDANLEFQENRIAYSNAMLGDTELYYALYKMDSAAWTLIFLVPSAYVATNTVELINMTIRLVMIFAVGLLLLCAAAIFWLTQRQQKAAVAAERRTSAKLEKLNGELVAASKAKSDFLANMSHDIRTPMNAIVGIVSLMEHDGDLTDKQHTYIQKIQMSSKHLLSLINDVLDMSKIESSEVVLNREPVSLAEQVGQVERIVRPQTSERGQEFTVRVHELRHEYLIGDSVRLRQIFINLLSNAVKYTPYGGKVSLDLAELPCETPDYATIRITVADNGYGMSPEFVKHIFEPFTRAENSVTNRIQGTGLGMAITKSIVDMVGGTIEIHSEVDKGSRFDVTLTMPIDHSAEREVKAKGVLLVAQEEVLIRNMDACMTQAKVPFRSVSTQAEAMRLLGEGKFDVILLAGQLRDQTLEETVRLMRKAAKGATLIFCCDYADREKVTDVLERCGVDGLIPRPFFLSNLISAIDHVRDDAPVVETHSVLQGKRFLCAEDNELNAEILNAILEINGASCVIYPNGAKLVEAFKTVHPGDYDAILMDVQMPVMNGLDATRAIRQGDNPLGATIPIIAMTANAFAEDVQNCLDAGMDAHVSKPLELSALERALQNTGKFSGGDTCSSLEDDRAASCKTGN